MQVFIQMFNSADAGTVNVIGALAALKNVDNSTISSSSAGGVIASPQNAFGLDQECLARCGLSASGGGLTGLSNELRVRPSPFPHSWQPHVCLSPQMFDVTYINIQTYEKVQARLPKSRSGTSVGQNIVGSFRPGRFESCPRFNLHLQTFLGLNGSPATAPTLPTIG